MLKNQILRKSVQWEPSCSLQKDKYDEANSRILQFFERPLKPGIYFKILNMRDKHTKTRTKSMAIQLLIFRQLPFPERKALDFWITHALCVPSVHS